MMVDEQPLHMEEDNSLTNKPNNQLMEKLKSSLTDEQQLNFKGSVQHRRPSKDQQFTELKRNSTMQKKRDDMNEFTYLVHDEPIPFGIEFMKQVQDSRSKKANN